MLDQIKLYAKGVILSFLKENKAEIAEAINARVDVPLLDEATEGDAIETILEALEDVAGSVLA